MIQERPSMIKIPFKGDYLEILYYWRQELLVTEQELTSEQERNLLSKSSDMEGEIDIKL